MAYSKKELIDMAVKAIKENKLKYIVEVVTYLPIERTRFYGLKLDKVNTIKKALIQSKIATKVALRKKWETDGSPATEIALYKLIADEEEFNRLTKSHLTVQSELFDGKTKEEIEEDLEDVFTE